MVSKRTKKQRLRRRRGGNIRSQCGNFEMRTKKVEDQFQTHIFQGKEPYIIILPKHDKVLELVFEKEVYVSLCEAQTVMEYVISMFKQREYTNIEVFEQRSISLKGPWKVGDVEVPLDKFYPSLDTLLTSGLFFCETMGFYTIYSSDYDERISILCILPANEIDDRTGPPKLVQLIQNYSLCELYLLIKHHKVDTNILPILGQYLHDAVQYIDTDYFQYFFDTSLRSQHESKLEEIKTEYLTQYSRCEEDILKLPDKFG